MSIRDRAKKVLDGFTVDSKITGYQGLGVGDYEMIVENVQQSNFGQLAVRVSVIDGEYAGRKEFINLSTDEIKQDGSPLPDFVIDRNIKEIGKLGLVLGVPVSDEAWDDMTQMVEEFKEAEGKTFIMNLLKLSPNKKSPSNPYKEYDFDVLENAVPEPIDIDDSDMPF